MVLIKNENMKKTRWVTDIQGWDKINKETSQLMLSQVEKTLAESIETAKIISAKSNQIILILIPISTIIIGYLIQHLIPKEIDFLWITAFSSLMCLFYSGYFSYKNFKPYKIALSGEYPHDIIISKYIDNELTSEQQYLSLFLNICENIESRIAINDYYNDLRIRNNEIAIKALFFIPICPLFSYLLLNLYSLFHCAL